MNNLDVQIKRIVDKIKIHLFVGQTIKFTHISLALGCIISIILIGVSRFVPIYRPYKIAGIILIISIVLGVLWSIIKMPKNEDVALKADSLGLKERIITSLELKDNETIIATMQKQDTLDELRKLDYKKGLSLVPDKKYIISAILLLCILGGTYFLPNPMEDIALRKHEIKIAKKDTIEKVEKIEKEIDNNEELSELMKDDIKKNLSKLKKEISEVNSSEDIDKALQKTDKKLELIKQEYMNNDLNQLAETLMKHDITKELGELLKEGNKEALLKDIEKSAEKLKNASNDQIKQLSNDLNKLAKQLESNPELAKALAELAQNLANSNTTGAADAMTEMASTLSELMQNQEFREAMENAQQALQQAMQNNIKLANNSNNTNKNGQNNGSKNGNSQNSNGSGNNNQSGQNGSKGNGQGNGNGEGAGSDMGSEDSPEGSQSGGLSKKNGNNGKNVSEYDKIFTPKTLGGEGETLVLKGQKNENGESDQVLTEKGIGVKGNSIPYNQVIGEYKNKAYENMEKAVIPESMKEVVKSYFSSLEE